MRGLLLGSLVTLAGLALAPPVRASGDYSCTAAWSLMDAGCGNVAFLHPKNDTRVNLQFLRADRDLASFPSVVIDLGADPPGNRDAPFVVTTLTAGSPSPAPMDVPAGAPPDPQRQALNGLLGQLGLAPFTADVPVFADGEGSRCVSDGFPSAQAFLQQVLAAPLSPDERRSLAGARLALLQDCAAANSAAAAAPAATSPVGRDFARYLAAAGKFYRGDFAAAQDGFREPAWEIRTGR